MSDISDQDFMNYANQYEEEEAERRKRGGGLTPNYEQIKWTGLEPNKMKIVRVCGGIPDAPGGTTFTSRTVQVARIKGDDGKEFRCVLPPKESGADHLMWRIISRVNEVIYVDKTRTLVNELKHPDIFDMINYNGLQKGDPKRKYNRGWEGRHVVVMNVIDREQLDWHKTNKHTMLLSRSVSTGTDGREFPEEGVPVFGFLNLIITSLLKHYGHWENFDIGIVRLGAMQNPYRVINASAYAAANLPEIPKELIPIVSTTKGLTEEEQSWVQYDLSKLFAPSTFTKIYNKLRLAIQTIDAKLGTTFFKELEFEVSKEKEARKKREADKPAEEPKKEEPGPANLAGSASPTTSTPAPTRSRTPSTTPLNALLPEKAALLKGWDQLTAEQKGCIKDVQVEKGNVSAIEYANIPDGVAIVGCPQCRVGSPETFTVCPACGIIFDQA